MTHDRKVSLAIIYIPVWPWCWMRAKNITSAWPESWKGSPRLMITSTEEHSTPHWDWKGRRNDDANIRKDIFFKLRRLLSASHNRWSDSAPLLLRDLWTCHVLGKADEKGGCIYTKILFSAAGHWFWMTGEGQGLDGLGSADTVCCNKQKTFGFSFLFSQERDSQLSTRSQREGMFLFISWRLAFLITSHVDQPLWKACNQNLLCSSFLDSP